jgi:hypothetical protein
MIRRVTGRLTYANAGSVGMPYEGRPGAFWLIVDDGVPELRETGYGLEVAWDELSRSGYPDLEELLLESLREPVDPARVTDFFEGLASRSLRGPSA